MFNKWTLNKFGEYYLPTVNASAFEMCPSYSIYSTFYPEIISMDKTFYIIIGSDSGLFFSYVSTQKKPLKSKYLFVEVSEVYHEIMARELDKSDDQSVLCDIQNWEDIANQMDLPDYVAIDKVKVIYSLAVMDNSCKAYAELRANLEASVEQILWKGKLLHAGYSFIEQQMKNLTENILPAKIFSECLSGGTAVLLAGGPSLDDAIEWVKLHREALLVVSVSRISQRLLDVGLVPDVIVSIDPTEKMFEVSKQMLYFPKQPIFVYAYHVNALLPCVWHGRSAYLGNRVPWMTSFNPDNLEVMGPTVTNAALHLLINMGIKQIILAGVDLSYSAQGYSHAQGSLEHAGGARLAFQGLAIELNDGSVGQTENAFFEASKTLAQQALYAQEQGCDIINYAAKAAKIEGIAYLPFDKIIFKKPTIPPLKILEKAIVQNSNCELDYYHQCQLELATVEKKLKQVEKLAHKAAKLHHQKQHIKKIDAIETLLTTQYADILTLTKIIAYRHFIDIFHAKISSTHDMESIINASRVCFEAYAKGAKTFLALIKSSQSRVNDRIAEHATPPNIKLLTSRWKKDKQFRRGSVWLENHPEQARNLSSAEKMYLQELETLFAKQMEFKMAVPMVDLSQYGQFKELQHKLYRLYRQADSEGLAQLEKSLAELKQPKAMLLASLARAYQHELLDETSLAISLYYQCANDWLMEVALNHLSRLLLRKGDVENACYALESLSCLGHQYLPDYAQLCEYCGDIQSAVRAYEKYLTIREEDEVVAKRLMKLKEQLPLFDSA